MNDQQEDIFAGLSIHEKFKAAQDLPLYKAQRELTKIAGSLRGELDARIEKIIKMCAAGTYLHPDEKVFYRLLTTDLPIDQIKMGARDAYKAILQVCADPAVDCMVNLLPDRDGRKTVAIAFSAKFSQSPDAYLLNDQAVEASNPRQMHLVDRTSVGISRDK